MGPLPFPAGLGAVQAALPLGRMSAHLTSRHVLSLRDLHMSISTAPSPRPTLEGRAPAPPDDDTPEWWPLAQSGGTFVPLDRQQCQSVLGRCGTGWLSRPGAGFAPRRLTSYTVSGTQLRFVPPLAIALPVGDVVLFQVAHFDARARTAWSVVLVGRCAEYAFEPQRRLYPAAPPLALPLDSTEMFGSSLATAS